MDPLDERRLRMRAALYAEMARASRSGVRPPLARLRARRRVARLLRTLGRMPPAAGGSGGSDSGTAGVREPRRPKPGPPAASVALPEPPPPEPLARPASLDPPAHVPLVAEGP